ncbi:alpha/beta hydrolase [Yinghuangia sp. KLBMP8922]|uniref:Alpha/beta hydrolase n=2 Tax=Yinghuangia soli TaxID=2908204 RepID=A0AA41PZI0_9ACTN|nr:alpha/beta hydrolase [Yinghuangia soli]
MRLFTHERGDGEKLALLIHGGMSDHRTWHAIEDDLVGRGYRVVSCDLRGHGQSPHGAYHPDLLADDLVESLPAGADLAIGHSMGALSLSLAAARLAPARAVYSEPGFMLGRLPAGSGDFMLAMVDSATEESVRAMNPLWSDKDIETEIAGFALFDRDFLKSVGEFPGDYLPTEPVVPSLVQLAEQSLCITPEDAAALAERGFEVRTVPGTGHCVHRDSVEGFMASLDGWV